MNILLLIFSAILIEQSYGGIILHNIRDGLHSKLYGHGIHGENLNQNSPIINVNNNQQVTQVSSPLSGIQEQPFDYGQTFGGNSRGDYGSLSNYNQNSYGANDGGYMNTNFKAGGMKYGHGGGAGMGYNGYNGGYNSLKSESFHHRQGPGSRFGQHHDTNIFGNSNIGSSSASAASSSSSSSSASSSSASSSSSTSGGGHVKPWRH